MNRSPALHAVTGLISLVVMPHQAPHDLWLDPHGNHPRIYI
jgi:hypothetical protein